MGNESLVAGNRQYERGRKSRHGSEASPSIPAPGKQTLQERDYHAAPSAHVGASKPGTVFPNGATPWADGGSTKGTSSSPAARSDDKVRARAIVSGLRAAQHELDTSGEMEDALRHLLHVGNVSPEYKGAADHEIVWAAADSFERSLRRRAGKQPGPFRRLLDLNTRIRSDIGLTGASKPGRDLSAGTDARFAKDAIGPALDALAIRTRDSLKFLEGTETHDQTQRNRAVERIAGDVEFTSDYVRGLLDTLPADERASHSSAADSAALAVGKVLRWVRSRPAHEHLEHLLVRSTQAFNAVLEQIGADKIEDRDQAPLSERGKHGSELEGADFKQAMDATTRALQGITIRQHQTIDLFKDLAGLDDQAQPDFKAALLNAVIDLALGNVIGQFAKLLATAPGATKSRTVKPPILERLDQLEQPRSGSGIEGVFTVGLGSLKTAMSAKLAGSTNVNPRKRALYYFCTAMHRAEQKRLEMYMHNLNGLESRGAITADQLRDIAHVTEMRTDTIVAEYLQEITKAWASYLAHSRLGTKGSGTDKVSNMRDYFGVEKPGGREFGTSRAGGDGTLSIVLRIEGGAAKPTLDHSQTKVVGLNSELKSHLFEAAGHDFNRVELPKEVHVEARFARATIALDEKNRIRDVRNWHEVQHHVGGATASGFWQLWGKNLKVG
jgi:hypothetical protein